jgi:hypothetical protein|tara:strand:+ start:869 stop:1813 length:945 start_codon:yes stop_codon:yes gene_type:complete
MTDKFTAAQWAEMEGGHEVTPIQDASFSFLKEIHESRMTKDNGSSQKLTYSDCGERLYLTLLALETMRQYPEHKATVKAYANKTRGFELYKFYRIMGTDLYNLIYFLVGDDSAQKKLKDPEAAIKLKKTTKIPLRDLNRYINAVAQGRTTPQTTQLFIKLEQALKVTNTDYKAIRRGLNDWSKTTRSDKRTIATRLIFAVRAKLRSSDIIIDFEKWASIKNMEKATAVDPEPTISRPDINTSTNNVVLYRYLVGNDKIAMAKKFLELAKDGRGIPSPAVQAYLPVIEMIDDLVQAGPAYIAQLRALHKRAKKDY